MKCLLMVLKKSRSSIINRLVDQVLFACCLFLSCSNSDFRRCFYSSRIAKITSLMKHLVLVIYWGQLESLETTVRVSAWFAAFEVRLCACWLSVSVCFVSPIAIGVIGLLIVFSLAFSLCCCAVHLEHATVSRIVRLNALCFLCRLNFSFKEEICYRFWCVRLFSIVELCCFFVF